MSVSAETLQMTGNLGGAKVWRCGVRRLLLPGPFVCYLRRFQLPFLIKINERTRTHSDRSALLRSEGIELGYWL